LIKSTKTIIGIFSMFLFMIIMFQSCGVRLVNVLSENTEDTSGSACAIFAIIFLIAGIIGVVTRKSKSGGITAGIFYLISTVIGFTNTGTFEDLVFWSVLSLCFGVTFIVGSCLMKKETS